MWSVWAWAQASQCRQRTAYSERPSHGQVPLGVHGEGIKIGIIDTGIDYTHADFGGRGRQQPKEQHSRPIRVPPRPVRLFGPHAPKVTAGVDMVGDDYNADARDTSLLPAGVPIPDSNPLDCNSHGTHVAGTAAGYGVLANGSTFHGPCGQTDLYREQYFRNRPWEWLPWRIFIRSVSSGVQGSTDVVTRCD